MQGKRPEREPVCGCDRTDESCAALTVRQLSQERTRELAEEIWARSTGLLLPGGPIPDPRRSRPGASAFAAYRRHRQLEREGWRPGWAWRVGAAGAAAITAGMLIGLSMGVWLGWYTALLVALLTGWRLRFRASATARVWRRQAVAQRRTAGMLAALEPEGYLVLHDITLPGWPASLDHLVVGPTGVWVIKSWRPSWLAPLRKGTSPRRAYGSPAGMLRGLHGEAAAVADALAGATSSSIRPLLCAHGGMRPAARGPVREIPVTTSPRQLADVIRHGPPVQRGEVERVTASALEVLRPAV
jgi:nuclease-like protein